MRIALFILGAAGLALAAEPDGASIYQERCATCHDNSSATRAPAPTALRGMSPENVIKALESGLMRDQGASLNAPQKQLVAEFLTAKLVGQGNAASKVGLCADQKAAFSMTGPAWNGWGVDLANTRFKPTDQAGLTAADVPKLKLKWAFAFPDTAIANGQPTIVGGRVFVPSANRKVYSLDMKTGCQYWAFEPQAPVRSAITVVALKGQTKPVAFFGDRRGNAYAVDATTGTEVWRTRVEEANPNSGISAAPAYYDGRLYFGVTAGGEGTVDLKVECCKGRGALVALDAATGKIIWKTYTIPEEPHPTTRNKAGTQLWGPSGVSIWSAPTVDVERKLIYAGTGDNFSDPPGPTSDAILAFDMETGKIAWVKQLTENDSYTVGCRMTNKEGCPESNGPDFDIGASPILVNAGGKRVLLVSQKSGVAHGLDPDKQGAILWAHRVGHGSPLGGIQWGSAADGQNMYVANSDISFTKPSFERGERRVLDPKPGGGLFAINIATGERVWAAPPPSCGDRLFCSPAQSAAVTVMPGAVFSGSVDGHIRGYSSRDGKILWDYDTEREYQTVNGLTAKGGSLDCPGPTIAGGMLFVESGYGTYAGVPGNVLLAFSVDGK